MFLQHMVASLKSDGMLATVMPHGVLFRGGDEKRIRAGLLENDLVEAVIGLASSLFYGTGIPPAFWYCATRVPKHRNAKARCCSSMRTGNSTKAAPRTTCCRNTLKNRQHLRSLCRSRQLLANRQLGGIAGERLQPEYPPLCGQRPTTGTSGCAGSLARRHSSERGSGQTTVV